MDLTEPFRRYLSRKSFVKSFLFVLFALVISGALYFVIDKKAHLGAAVKNADKPISLDAFPIKVPTIKYGFAIDTFQVLEREIQSGQFLADILLEQQLDYPSIEKIVANSKDIFDVRHFRVGNQYTILTKDSTQRADYFIYEPSVYDYVVYHLKDDFKVERFEREKTIETRASAGVIESSLWNAMVNNGMSFELTAKMEDALQWSIDFHHVQKNDAFKLIYDQNYIEGKKVGVGQVYAAYYKNLDNEYYAIYYKNGKHEGYYDLEGRPMKSFFLKSPVKYSRISSYYNLNRFHPILKRRRPHLGTDYAAPYGTPIYAVGNGVVTRAGYTKGNGNFVKIKHDDTYETQYLHMQKFAKGVRTGVHVKQGQVIGYVGSTGLATGPHVCFRFWKNGRQINHLRLSFPPPEPLPEEELPKFKTLRDQYLAQLEQLPLPNGNNTSNNEDKGIESSEEQKISKEKEITEAKKKNP